MYTHTHTELSAAKWSTGRITPSTTASWRTPLNSPLKMQVTVW